VIEIREVEWDHPASVSLRAAQRSEIDARYGTPDSEPGPAPTGSDISVFLVAFEGERGVGCGGLRELDAEHGEIKRMYVQPQYRGSGVATALLRALEKAAGVRGWNRLVLETGDRQPDAIRFYEREGYTRIPNFGYYADSESSLCYGRALAPQ
jgi:GNAT superfamily N-acetyltransferase